MDFPMRPVNAIEVISDGIPRVATGLERHESRDADEFVKDRAVWRDRLFRQMGIGSWSSGEDTVTVRDLPGVVILGFVVGRIGSYVFHHGLLR